MYEKKPLAGETWYDESPQFWDGIKYRPIDMRVIRNNNAALNGQYNNNNLILYYI
jgi:hypothetical protein